MGGPSARAGRVYPKGLGMHSASRLTYRIPSGWERLAAQVAIDQMSGERGSVVFRVELLGGGQWQEAYRSPIVRGGQPPRGLAVELAGAEQLALITEYADRGDEWDDANWLDARLERRCAGICQEPGPLSGLKGSGSSCRLAPSVGSKPWKGVRPLFSPFAFSRVKA